MRNKGTIIIGSDHAGYNLKEYVKTYLTNMSYMVDDVGTDSRTSVDYPDFAEKVGLKVIKMRNNRGIVTCGSGIGASIAANKIPGVRAALVDNVRAARLSREHNDANVLVLAGRPYNKNNVKKIIKTWLTTTFLGGRHQRRVKKIANLEKKYK